MESNTETWKRRELQQSANLFPTQLQLPATALLFNTEYTAVAQGLCGCTGSSSEYKKSLQTCRVKQVCLI